MKTINHDEIIGYPEEQKELAEIADCFINYSDYQKKGLDVPKGLLLTGAPGTGKTLFAKVLAQTTNSPLFIYKSNVSMINSGAGKLRRMFKRAAKKAPAIIFIDEIERYIYNGDDVSDSSNKFVATLLSLLDGLNSYKGVMLIGATNEPNSIPQSLQRSGRMDEKIDFQLPSRKDREKIIAYYLNKISMPSKANPKILAFKTNGFSGADLKNLVNMSARRAKADKKTCLKDEDFYDPIHCILFSDIKRANIADDMDKIAAHEIGHLLTCKLLLDISADVAIDAYGDSLGSTLFSDFEDGLSIQDYDRDEDDEWDEEEDNNSKSGTIIKSCDFYLKLVSSVLGGRAAEETVYKQVFPNDSGDIEVAKNIVRNLCDSGCLGIDYISFETQDSSESDSQKSVREHKIISLLNERYQVSKKLIEDNKSLFDELVKALMDRTYLSSEESDVIFKKHRKDIKI